MAQQILASTTAAAASSPVAVLTRRAVTLFCQPALVAAEVATLQISPDQGLTWVNVIQGGSQVQLSATNTIVRVDAPAIVRLNKGATVSATALFAATEDNR
jgi:hypothetical protein